VYNHKQQSHSQLDSENRSNKAQRNPIEKQLVIHFTLIALTARLTLFRETLPDSHLAAE
jgi:hypothetical protein